MPIIETYKGFDIWYNPIGNIYLALQNGMIILFDNNIQDLKKQIDNLTEKSKR